MRADLAERRGRWVAKQAEIALCDREVAWLQALAATWSKRLGIRCPEIAHGVLPEHNSAGNCSHDGKIVTIARWVMTEGVPGVSGPRGRYHLGRRVVLRRVLAHELTHVLQVQLRREGWAIGHLNLPGVGPVDDAHDGLFVAAAERTGRLVDERPPGSWEACLGWPTVEMAERNQQWEKGRARRAHIRAGVEERRREDRELERWGSLSAEALGQVERLGAMAERGDCEPALALRAIEEIANRPKREPVFVPPVPRAALLAMEPTIREEPAEASPQPQSAASDGSTVVADWAGRGRETPYAARPRPTFGKKAAADRFEDAVMRLFRDAGRQVVAALSAIVAAVGQDAFDEAAWNAAVAETLGIPLAKLVADAAAGAVEDLGMIAETEGLGIAFDVQSPPVRRIVEEHLAALERWGSDLKADVARVVDEGVAQGRSVQRIARQLRQESGAPLSERRAELIARSESVAATNAGMFEASSTLARAGVLGRAPTKTWRTSIDGRERPEHAALNGQAVPVDAPFTIDGSEGQYPGAATWPPGLRVNCRCVVTYEPDARQAVPRVAKIEHP